ncbi:hypothetical protein POF51_26060 [Brevibacillus sp. AG]|uniref:hypothetical protein n=1 Tax=Brevibacillus sp. AG TaxID=3020891 RepID=UPI00232BEB55|nr:hypothetical protein [Brevibacillus sp. AG]MDC0764189.1 hypothetical protein [Brevibacillus sp. AG]
MSSPQQAGKREPSFQSPLPSFIYKKMSGAVLLFSTLLLIGLFSSLVVIGGPTKVLTIIFVPIVLLTYLYWLIGEQKRYGDLIVAFQKSVIALYESASFMLRMNRFKMATLYLIALWATISIIQHINSSTSFITSFWASFQPDFISVTLFSIEKVIILVCMLWLIIFGIMKVKEGERDANSTKLHYLLKLCNEIEVTPHFYWLAGGKYIRIDELIELLDYEEHCEKESHQRVLRFILSNYEVLHSTSCYEVPKGYQSILELKLMEDKETHSVEQMPVKQ